MKIRYKFLRLFVAVMAVLVGNVCCLAQEEYEIGYDYLYSSAHRVKVRKIVECAKNNQQLWNGDYVRLDKEMVYIYRGNECITRGYQVWLEPTGYYSVSDEEGEQTLVDSNGQFTGVQGEELVMLWNGVVCVLRDNLYYLYSSDGKRVGSVYSEEMIEIYHNGYYCYRLGAYYRVASPKGEGIKNTYSDSKPELMDNGLWRCKQNGHIYFVDKFGRVSD